jgi:hypothetical protein
MNTRSGDGNIASFALSTIFFKHFEGNATNSKRPLHILGTEARKVVSFRNVNNSYICEGYEFIYSREYYVGNIEDSIPAVSIVSKCKTSEVQQQIYMMDAHNNTFDMSAVLAEIAEADVIPSWIGSALEEYFPRKSLDINEAGEIIISLKHSDSKTLITSDHSLYVFLKAIVDSGASVCIFKQRESFKDFIQHPLTIQTAGTPIVAEGYGTVGKLQNCLNLISVSHVFFWKNQFNLA